MTWNETHERTRIFREVEAAAAADMSGAVPWRAEWTAYFGSPAGLVTTLRARWNRTLEAQVDAQTGEDELHDTVLRLRRAHAGVLRILEQQQAPVERVLPLTRAAVAAPSGRGRIFRFRGGPVLPTG